jgi:hypothetical protein
MRYVGPLRMPMQHGVLQIFMASVCDLFTLDILLAVSAEVVQVKKFHDSPQCD